MGKYFTAYKNSLSSFFQYRLNLGLLLISHIVSLSGLLYLWIAVYAGGQTIGSYTLTGIATYYLILTVLKTTIANGVGMGFQVVDNINEGVITNNLLKPFSYPLEQFVHLLGEGTINTLFITPIVLLAAFFARHIIALPSLEHFLLFLLMSVMGLLFYFLFYFLVSLSSFWVTHGGNFIYGMIIVSSFLNGSMLPLDLFPEWYLRINVYLPFQYLIFLPIQAYLGRIQDIGQTLLIGGIWLAIFIAAVWGVWRLGIKKYEAVGK
ncbi:MAG: hypothetical protein GW939_01250 [Candidatus Magasanikbacteria bacterium]|uniref:ABC transporter permease n=1 Tax=Candidatus Magasanikbacteria bacterium CG10_big_fil_rev_8_21_14_0_10_38_6 TaxID=1974647 RepID=A0A2M6NZJ7_9BACT|nr:hypothetical protein [Candidatus Magasanikbacteria bacterium]NCS72174.1 hypothetical protein [Candidatus Magasanikbacteria bacterium]PIR76848.1 MAG: hypothetical protein COU30_05670 [Candidatus Magasanikbacteria bacterium CG10_big_fil_rev_8_21_14_0_10_38_6]